MLLWCRSIGRTPRWPSAPIFASMATTPSGTTSPGRSGGWGRRSGTDPSASILLGPAGRSSGRDQGGASMADRDRSERMFAILDRVRYPVDVSIGHRGDALAVAVLPAHYETGSSFESRIWRVSLDGDAEQLTFGPRMDAMPRWSPTDDRLPLPP